MNDIREKGAHSFTSKSREGIQILGVNDVVSFDEQGVVLESICGNMAVDGENLHITELNITDGCVEIQGKINGVYYFEEKAVQKRGLFSRKSN